MNFKVKTGSFNIETAGFGDILDITEQVQKELSESSLFDGRQVSALRDCMEELPRKSRELVHSRYHEGWNAAQMAEKFQIKAATIRQALLRVRRQLYQCIVQRVKEA